MTKHFDTTALTVGTQVFIPLNRLKKSPDNARKTPHTEAALAALRGSIAAKGILQNLIVKPETDDSGVETGFFSVTIGEGRRIVQTQRASVAEISDDEPMPCMIRLTDDAHEVSLDENVTREAMHPADQFEAFRTLNVEQGMGVEDIAARFGISAQTVRQRLRLGAVSPRLLQTYRDGALTLDQLIAFCITEDHARQEAVYDRLSSWQREPYHIRRLLTETHVGATDRRAKFVGADTYLNAGGHIERDLFTEDGGGFFADAGLLDRLALDGLTAIAVEVQETEGWKWSEAHIDFPHGHGLRRVYQKTVPLSEADQLAEATAQAEFDQLTAEYEGWEELPDDVDKRFGALEADLEGFDCLKAAFDPEDIQRGGIIVSLTHDGSAKIERGLIRLEDLAPEPERTDQPVSEGGEGDAGHDDQDNSTPLPEGDDEPDKPLSDALIRDLTTHRTLALRLALGEQPELATRALAHRLVLDIFYRHLDIGGLEVKATSSFIAGFAEGLDETPTATALQTRHDAWAAQLPQDGADLWVYLMALEAETLGALMAHCVAQTVNVVKQPYGNVNLAKAGDQLASSLHLDMAEHWRPTARSYFGRVTKSHIVEAVREAVGPEAADRLSTLKKQAMAEAAEQLVAGTGWLPALLRTPEAQPQERYLSDAADQEAARVDLSEDEPLPDAAE